MRIVAKFGAELSLPAGWIDSSGDAGNSDRLLTLTRSDGVGALQMSFGVYVSGKLPDICLDDLRTLLAEFAATRRLGAEQSPADGGSGGVEWCRADYHQEGDFIRVWYISNSKSVILATYVCEWQHKGIEPDDCNWIVESVKFVATSAPAS